jgi:site-specific DNA-methyltransferase (adenine-specific)
VEKYIDQCRKLLFVLPTRGFTGGNGLQRYREMMLHRRDLVYIDTIPDSDHPFGTAVQISGGVCHFLKDSSYSGKCSYNGRMIHLDACDILVESKFMTLIQRMKKYQSITQTYCSKGHYGIRLTDKRLRAKRMVGDIVCHVSKRRGGKNYIKASSIPKGKLGRWKVVTVTASTDGGGFGNMFIAGPDEVHSESFLSFETKTKKQALSLMTLLKCKLSNLLLALRKPHTHNIASDACKWIPAVPLDRMWTDAELHAYLKLSRQELRHLFGK